ncbi:MAG TPA: TadE family protein [Methylomirabilota bacterium]|nr:TadE family protein [Methylomirabilota bacterium]
MDGLAPETQIIHRDIQEGSRPAVRATSIRRRSGRGAERRSEAGQSLVEFSLILLPLFFILLGIIQFGFIFNTYVTMTNAARDAARLATTYVFDHDCSKAQNDILRNEAIRTSLVSSMNQLSTTGPRFTTTAPTTTSDPCVRTGGWTSSGSTFTNGDLVITYVVPTGITDEDSRTGQEVTVSAVYHQDLIVPLVSGLLPKDAGGRLPLTGVVTMVLN